MSDFKNCFLCLQTGECLIAPFVRGCITHWVHGSGPTNKDRKYTAAVIHPSLAHLKDYLTKYKKSKPILIVDFFTL